jgi:hypothetical protein
MAFHYSNFGMFSNQLKAYADLDGYVPEYGDKLTDFHYPHGHFDDPEATAEEIEDEWREFIERAAEATKAAEKEAKNWQDE